jgi:hypothetical protein
MLIREELGRLCAYAGEPHRLAQVGDRGNSYIGLVSNARISIY